MDNENQFLTFVKNHTHLFSIVTGLLIFLAFLFPLVNGHGVTYDTGNWEFGELERTVHGVGIIFGVDSAIVWPLIVIYSLILVAILLTFLSFMNNKLAVIGMMIFLLSGVLLLFSNYFYAYANAISTAKGYASELGDYYYWYVGEYIKIADPRLETGSVFAVVMCFISAIITFSSSYSREGLSVGEMTEMGILISSAVVLDIIFHYVPNIPGQVGSISIALLPLYFLALRHGPIKGLFAASFVYGLITCFTDNYGIWLYPLDYMVAFSGVAIIGLFRKQILNNESKTYNFKSLFFIFLSVMLAGLVRLIGSGASSILNYNYTFMMALVANGLYTTISSLICATILMAAYPTIIYINKHFPIRKDISE